MRITCFCLIAVALAIILASPILADQSSDFWQWSMVAAASNGSDGYDYWRGTIFVSTQATDGYDGEPLITSWPRPTTYAAVFHDEGAAGWNGSTGFYLDNYVGPLAPGQTKTWQLYVWSTPDMPADYDTTHFMMNRMDNIALTGDFQFRLMLKSKPSSITGGPDVGTAWDLDMPGFEIEFPTYRTDNGLTGYEFEFSATAVPEASSFLALSIGLVGLILRRKR